MIGQQSPLKAPADTGLRPQRWRVAALCLVLAAITFVVFGQTLRHEFVDFDDDVYVYQNATVTSGLSMKGVARVFTHAECYLYHPLTMLSLMADEQLHGLNAGGYHFTNVLLHTASVILLFLILLQMTGAFWRSAFVAAVFAIHPLRVESVAWVAERKDVLSGLFFMLTLGAYVRYVRKPDALGRYIIVAATFVLALLSKPTVVTLPFVLLLLDYWPLQRFKQPGPIPRRLILEKIPLLALAAATGVITVLVSEKGIAVNESIPPLSRLCNAVVSYGVYLRQMVWPRELTVPYPFVPNGGPAWAMALAGALLIGLTAVAWATRRTRPWMLVGWLWYLGILAPMIGIVQVGVFAHADRFTYLAQIGIYMAVAWLAAEWGVKFHVGRVAMGVLMTAVLGALIFFAWKQTAYWKNSETLWNHALACDPGNYIARVNLGADLLNHGRPDEVIAIYQKALQTQPNSAESHNNLGNALMQKRKLDDALVHYQAAVQLKPDYADAQHNLGTVLLYKGKTDEAMTHYEAALQIDPNFADAQYNLGSFCLQKGKVDEAIAHYQAALQIKPGYEEAHYRLGNALREKGSVNEAIGQYQEALQLKPDDTAAHVSLGISLLQAGRVDEAIVQCQKALDIKADNADAHYNLGNAFLQKGNFDEAITQLQAALQINPGHVDAHINLGNILLQTGRVDEAITHFQKALRIKPDDARTQNNLGNAFLQKGNVGDAIAQYQKALQLEPSNASVQNNLAWLLATCAEASLRNGSKALELAQQANALTGGENPIVLHTLAAAFAEAGQFSKATETAQHALRLAETQSNTRLAGALQSEMNLYQANMPFHISQPTN